MVEATASEPGEAGNKTGPVFRLSLAMSGAISAGAYTAGVLDFLIQAMSEWDANRPPNSHAVRLVSFAGASAGGITAAIGTVALGYGIEWATDGNGKQSPKLHELKTSTGGTITCVLPKLYTAWVIRPRMVADSGPDLLSLEDINATSEVRSLLNWKVLDFVREEALTPPGGERAVPPVGLFAEPFDVYLTISNMRGIPYQIGKGQDTYRMLDHGDRLHFRINNLGNDSTIASDWSAHDQAINLDAGELRTSNGNDAGWQLLGDAALATAAFPGGLSARILRSKLEEFEHRQWPTFVSTTSSIKATYPEKFPHPDPDFGYVNVDGGMINNDPFEFARYTLLQQWRIPNSQNDRCAATTDCAVVMISPFPEGAPFDANDPLDYSLFSVIKRLLPTLIQQARFKPSEVAAAADAAIASRWIISPRGADGAGPATSANIACGLLGGFGGFLDQSFREHDYQLGKRNCQKFLRDGFCLDAANQNVFGGTVVRTPGVSTQVILPLAGSAVPEVTLPRWPHMSLQDFDILMARISKRADAIVVCLLAKETQSRIIHWGARLLWCAKRRDFLAYIGGLILADLIRRDLIMDGLDSSGATADAAYRLTNFSTEARIVLATLTDTTFALRTAAAISRTTKLPVAFVEAALTKGMSVPSGGIHKVWKSSLTVKREATYTLYTHRLPFYQTWPFVGRIARFFLGAKIG